MKDGLSKLQQLFADRYIETGNAGQSYIDAGYKAKNMNVAYASAHQLLRSPKIQAYINRLLSEKESERIASQDEVLELLTQLARGEMTEEMIIAYQNKATYEKATRQAPPRDRAKALELLGKRYLLFTDRQQIEANVESTQYIAEWGTDDKA
jgi:phage terminase small subunit